MGSSFPRGWRWTGWLATCTGPTPAPTASRCHVSTGPLGRSYCGQTSTDHGPSPLIHLKGVYLNTAVRCDKKSIMGEFPFDVNSVFVDVSSVESVDVLLSSFEGLLFVYFP